MVSPPASRCIAPWSSRNESLRLPTRHSTQAPALTDMVIDVIAGLPAHCERVYVRAPPDNVRGAYIARNGLTQAVAQAGRSMRFVQHPDDAPPECRVDFSDLAQQLTAG